MLVQDPLSGYLHEVPNAHPYYGGYGGYGGGYYGGYDEYIDPSMAEYPGELGHLGFLPFLPQIIGAASSAIQPIVSAITGGGAPAPAPPPPVPPPQPIPGVYQPQAVAQPMPQAVARPIMMIPSAGGEFLPPPGLRAYIFSVVRDAVAELQPEPMVSPGGGGGFRRRRRRR